MTKFESEGGQFVLIVLQCVLCLSSYNSAVMPMGWLEKLMEETLGMVIGEDHVEEFLLQDPQPVLPAFHAWLLSQPGKLLFYTP